MGFANHQIRPLAVALLRQGNKLLALDCFDTVKQQRFYRLLGGGIEFGEKAEETVVREFREELGLAVKVTKRLGVDESIFIYEGKQGHEIVFFFEAEFVNPEDYDKEFHLLEKELAKNRVIWVEINDENRIYPEAFRKFISAAAFA